MPRSGLVPVHHQIYLTLRNELTSGHYGDDGPLPDEPSLAARFGVSRMTLRRALGRLQDERLIVRKPAVGTFAVPRERPAPIQNSIAAFYDALRTDDITRHKLRASRFVATPAFLRQPIDFGPECLRVAKVGFHARTPVHFGTHFVPAAIARRSPSPRGSRHGDLQWLHELGVTAARTDLYVSASAADIEAARILGVEAGTPVISTRRFAFDADDRPIEYLEGLSRPDRFTYAFRFTGGAAGTP